MKDDFIATASHELRTPLTGVQGFLDLLLDYPGSRDDADGAGLPHSARDLRRRSWPRSPSACCRPRAWTPGRWSCISVRCGWPTVVEEVLRLFRELQQAQGGATSCWLEIPPDVYMQADLGRLERSAR